MNTITVANSVSLPFTWLSVPVHTISSWPSLPFIRYESGPDLVFLRSPWIRDPSSLLHCCCFSMFVHFTLLAHLSARNLVDSNLYLQFWRPTPLAIYTNPAFADEERFELFSPRLNKPTLCR